MTTEEAVFLMDEGFLYILSCFQEGLRDRDISVELLHYLALRGASEPLYYPQVRFGEDTASGSETFSFRDRPLRRGESVAISLRLATDQGEVSAARHFFYGLEPSGDLVERYVKVQELFKKNLSGTWPPDAGNDPEIKTMVSPLGNSCQLLSVVGRFSGMPFGIHLAETVRLDAAGPAIQSRFTTDLLAI